MNKKRNTVFSNFEKDKKSITSHITHLKGPFMNEFGKEINSYYDEDYDIKPNVSKNDNKNNK